MTVSTLFAFGMSAVLPQKDAEEFPATLAGGSFGREADGEGKTDREADGDGDGESEAGPGRTADDETDGAATGAASDVREGVREEGAHPAIRVTTDNAERLHTRRRTRAA
ncbi:hypothetical protein ACIA5C_19510 [Actinoplanes sp. NPDC051343]|uniref:hypothetical protein n=1 Tax=Actinoplanes sp. NPDC051343 TaxID=3363906 RepID=UPI00378931CB